MDLLAYHLDKVNWVAVLVATLGSFVVGSIWYAPPVFGKIWMKAIGQKPKDMKNSNMAGTFALTGVLAFVSAVGLATLMSALVFKNWQQGAVLGALVASVFTATTRGIHMLFERKGGIDLFVINAGHDIVFMTLAGAIIGLF
jgi:hypothetical protein